MVRLQKASLLRILLAILIISGFGCSPVDARPGQPTSPASSGTHGPTATLAGTPYPVPANLQEAKVVRVVDGDTIHVEIKGKRQTLRYIGINTPETVDPRRPVEFFGKEAGQKNKELVGGKTVKLEKDVSETDRYGRLLRYVYVSSTFVNAELVKLGYAQAATFPPDVKYAELFRQLEREARENKRGLWAAAATVTPGKPTPTPTRR